MIPKQCLTPQLLPEAALIMALTEGELAIYRSHLLNENRRVADVEFLLCARKRQLDLEYFRKHPELLPVRIPAESTQVQKPKRRTRRPKTKEEKLAALVAAALVKTGQSMEDFLASTDEGGE